MVRYCSVPQCTTYASASGISFHHYPRDRKLRARWIFKLKIGKPVTAHAMICSLHFAADAFKVKRAGAKGCKNRYLKPTAVPSENLPKGTHDRVVKTRKPPRGDRENPSSNEHGSSIPHEVDRGTCNKAHPSAEHFNIQEECEYIRGDEASSCAADSEATMTCEEDGEATLAFEDDSDATLTCDEENEVAMSSGECSEAATSCEELSDDDSNGSEAEWTEKSLQHHTAESPTLMDACIQVDTRLTVKLGPRISLGMVKSDKELVALSGVGSLQLMKNIVREFNDIWEQMSSKASSLCSGDLVLMVMVKLYHNISLRFLAFLFRIHRTTVSNNLKTALCVLSHVLGAAIFTPSADSIEEHLTVYFTKFPRTKLILDCTEIAIQRPADLTSRILTYSHYKKTYTAKVLVGCAPTGMITFVSNAYGGRTSDSFITKESKVLEQCSSLEQVMVDKGFLIDKLCDDARVELIRPPFLRSRQQMSQRDALMNQDIARARVHVERAIQRLKVFKILQQRFPTHLMPLLDDVVRLVAGIVNLSPPIFAGDKFL